MLALYCRDQDLLRDDVRVLAVGAGSEPSLFWLTRHVGHVLATDIYGAGDFATREASASMLTDPAHFAPYPYRPDRLAVISMDARNLESLTGALTLSIRFRRSSISEAFERCGGPLAEMARVLKPGGHAY